MFLHEVPFKQLRIGDQVVSHRGRPGRISALGTDRWDWWEIEWSTKGKWENENQTKSYQYHFPSELAQPTQTIYIGRPE